jgi:hypothetical protein
MDSPLRHVTPSGTVPGELGRARPPGQALHEGMMLL